MKILFVCRQNVGRSQMAAALYNAGHPHDHADSAGAIVEASGQKLKDFPTTSPIVVMQELGIDMSNATRQQVTPELLNGYDKIVVMSEPDSTPDWLRDNPKSIIWKVPDTRWMELDGVREMRDKIQQLIATTL